MLIKGNISRLRTDIHYIISLIKGKKYTVYNADLFDYRGVEYQLPAIRLDIKRTAVIPIGDCYQDRYKVIIEVLEPDIDENCSFQEISDRYDSIMDETNLLLVQIIYMLTNEFSPFVKKQIEHFKTIRSRNMLYSFENIGDEIQFHNKTADLYMGAIGFFEIGVESELDCECYFDEVVEIPNCIENV